MKFFGIELRDEHGGYSAKIGGDNVIVQYRVGTWIASLHLGGGVIIAEALTSKPNVDRSDEVLRLLEAKVRQLRTKLEALTVPTGG
jgi:hypothetical protein